MFKRPPITIFAICLGIGLLGMLGTYLPVLSTAEEHLGLDLLYRLRGPEPPEADVVIVGIDSDAGKALALPSAPHKWPRTIHARLLERLISDGAAVVAFDLIFHEPQRPTDDQALAAAMRQAGNVILTQSIDRQSIPLVDHDDTLLTQVNIEQIISPIPILANAAIGQAPFLLPKVPIKLNQYWRFSPLADDSPTLPVVVMHAYAMNAFDEFIGLLEKTDPLAASSLPVRADEMDRSVHIIQSIRPLYRLFQDNPDLADQMVAKLDRHPTNLSTSHTHRLVRALIEIYRPDISRYLNLYGPPGTIETIAYHQLLEPTHLLSIDKKETLPSLRGKAVFVGQTEGDWSMANDGFYTAFSDASGRDISGLEIAATAFANLLENKTVHPLGTMAQLIVFMAWGMATTLISTTLSTQRASPALLLLNGAYVGLAHIQFKTAGIWFPLVIPLLVQAPIAFIAGLVWKYRRANQERQNIRKAFGHYLPKALVSQLATDVSSLRAGGQVIYSICLFTDAERYTTLSETMDPQSLTELVNQYYKMIFKPIKAHNGLVSQVIGDSVLALWTAAQPSNTLKTQACRAAVEITDAVFRFNSQSNPYHLPTRIGIHAGEIVLGNIGTMDHFEYRPVGDIVNTASRLEGLNKYLGTRMLTSEEALGSSDDLFTRPVGRFIFKGKSKPVDVRELLPQGRLTRDLQAAACRIFGSGLEAFKRQNWDEAEKSFHKVLQVDKDDGPSRFYLQQCQEFRQTPPGNNWDGSVQLKQK